MTPQVISLSSLGSTAWIPVDYKQNPFNIGLACVVSDTPNLTYQVEFTLDDIFNTSITPTAFTHNLLVGKTSNFSSNQIVPVRAIRLTTTAYTSGTVTLTALQGGVNPIIYTPNPVTLFQSGIPFGILPGDGGANGLDFTDSIGNFTLSAAVVTDFYRAFIGGGYLYFPAGTAGVLDGWYFAVMSSDTARRVYAEKYEQGTGTPQIIASPTSLSGLSTGRITQSTSEITAFTFTLPGGAMGPNGRVVSTYARAADATGTKTVRLRLDGTALFSEPKTTSSIGESSITVRNIGSQARQWGDRGAYSGTISTTQYTTVDTSANKTVTVSLQSSLNTIGQFVCGFDCTAKYGA